MILSKVSEEQIKKEELIKGNEIREGVLNLIQKENPEFNQKSCITLDELNKYRRIYLTQLVDQEKGEIAIIDSDVLKAIRENSILSENIKDEEDGTLTLGQKMADNIALFGGSWTFIIIFFTFLLLWIFLNVYILATKSFDPYPFILLNLILSCLASIQAPILMMSQNRQEQKDRIRAEHDYKINLKAELEIKLLSEKMDHILVHHNKKLIEIQEIQIDYLEDMMKQMKGLSEKNTVG
jgi:uncharacterized membrane protein